MITSILEKLSIFMKSSWLLQLDIGCFVGQLIAGVFDDDLMGLAENLEKLATVARSEIKKGAVIYNDLNVRP